MPRRRGRVRSDRYGSSNTRARYTLFAKLNTCTSGCSFGRTGEWFDFGTQDLAGFINDPVASFETEPIAFAFGLDFPILVSLSLETQATADTEAALAEAFADFGGTLRWRVSEVRDSQGQLVPNASIDGASGVSYLPEPSSPTLGLTALLAIGCCARRARTRDWRLPQHPPSAPRAVSRLAPRRG